MSVNLKGWDSEVKLFPTTSVARIRAPKGGWYYPVSHMEITVTRDGRLGDEMVHGEAAQVMIERLLVFLQFKVWNSLFDAIEKYQRYYSSNGDEAGRAKLVAFEPQLELVSDYPPQNMHDYMAELFSRDLAEALLHDVVVSIEHKRNRRACLELTMACETILGMRLDSASLVKASMGDVFKNRFSQEYEDISRLFHARDAIKQSGNGLFKFISAAKRHEVEQDLTRWCAAVECLADWLNAMNRGLQEAQ
jgi:hypothetical protein